MGVFVTRLKQAVTTWPDARGWRDTVLLLAVWSAAALLIGGTAGFLRWGWSDAPPGQLVSFAAVALVAPCLAEELLFRVLLVPHRQEGPNPLWWCHAALALALFVAWHPLNGWLLKVTARSVFFDPAFLALAALLGLVCTLAYRRTGSVWPPVAVHWLTLMVWKVGLGGRIIAMAS